MPLGLKEIDINCHLTYFVIVKDVFRKERILFSSGDGSGTRDGLFFSSIFLKKLNLEYFGHEPTELSYSSC